MFAEHYSRLHRVSERPHWHTVVDAKMFENGIVEVCCRCGQWMPGAKHDENWVEQVEKAMKNSACQNYPCPDVGR
jgi:hypothetical protein